MLDFDILDGAPTRVVTKEVAQPIVEERVSVRPSVSAAFVATPESEWSWSDLRDYCFREMEQRHGPQVRDPRKEASIFKSHMGRYGAEQSIAIAKFAFTVEDGWWKNAPISVTRFCKGSDPYFSDVISERLK